MITNNKILVRSISATIENGKNLLGDAKLLFEWDRYSTALAIAVLSQEEFSKAFLLQLVADGALPWTSEVRRSMAMHECKHLLAIVMEWLSPWEQAMDQCNERSKKREEWMAWAQRRLDRYKQGLVPDLIDPEPKEPEVSFSEDVATALNIYRHEEIERMKSGQAFEDDEWSSGHARKIADGLLDRKKQSGFYVDITKNGDMRSHPKQITRDQASKEIERAERLSEGPSTLSHEYYKLKQVLPLLFEDQVKSNKEERQE